MVNDWRRLNIYLDTAQRGFFVIETCENDVLKRVLSSIESKRKSLIVDFAKVNTDYYNENFDKDTYNCVVFCNLEYSKDAAGIIDSFNMNRDNFAANGIVYVFILPKYLSNYLIVRTPNLHSYVTSRIDLSRTYEPPFRPLMSLDNFIIDKRQISEEKKARRDMKSQIGVSSNRELFYNIEYYKYNRASNDDLINLLDSARQIYSNYEYIKWQEDFLQAEVSNLDDIERFYVEFAKVSFNQGRHRIAEYASMLALSLFIELPMDNFVEFRKYTEERVQYRSILYVIVSQSFTEVATTYIRAIRMIELIRVYATSLFYQKEYDAALDWFNLVNTMITYCVNRGFIMDDMLCLNYCDISLCFYKIHQDQINDKLIFYFDKALGIKEKRDLDVKTIFVLDYNDLVYKIKKGNVRYEDYNFSSGRAEYYKNVCSEKSSIFASYLSLVAWVRGCIDGNVVDALNLNRYALALKRSVLTENHYSIAESHYCNAVLYFMLGEIEKSFTCANKALKVLKVNEKKNHTLIELIRQFYKIYDSFYEFNE